jgi:hypothetical protein
MYAELAGPRDREGCRKVSIAQQVLTPLGGFHAPNIADRLSTRVPKTASIQR